MSSGRTAEGSGCWAHCTAGSGHVPGDRRSGSGPLPVWDEQTVRVGRRPSRGGGLRGPGGLGTVSPRPRVRHRTAVGGGGSRRASKFSRHSGTAHLSSAAFVLVPEQGRGCLLEVFRKSACSQLAATVQGRACSWRHTRSASHRLKRRDLQAAGRGGSARSRTQQTRCSAMSVLTSSLRPAERGPASPWGVALCYTGDLRAAPVPATLALGAPPVLTKAWEAGGVRPPWTVASAGSPPPQGPVPGRLFPPR